MCYVIVFIPMKNLPFSSSTAGYKSTSTVSSIAGLAYARFNLSKFVWKVEGVYGQNLADHLMLGGYGVESKVESTGIETYTPTTVFSAWTDIETNNTIALGFFAGVTQNLGSGENLNGAGYWARGADIDKIYRISPRILWNSAKTTLAAELEYTAASYGATASDATVKDADFVGNMRLLLAAYYYF